MAGEVLCTLTQAEKRYGSVCVLGPVSLSLHSGEIVGIRGPNGAGKSTLLSLLSGVFPPDAGQRSCPGDVAARIGYVPQGREIFPQLTVRENLLLGLEAGGRKLREIPEEIFETFPILKEFLERKGGDLSGGQQQQLAIARAVIASPKVLVLDEPTEGIQPPIIQEIGQVITRLKSRMAVLIVEQYLEFVMEIADYCYVMENGRIIMKGEPDSLDQEKLQATMSL